MSSIGQLLSTKRFAPLFVTQFLTAFNDNFFKNALIALLTYGLTQSELPDFWRHNGVFLAGVLFVLPYFLFSASAGLLAERVEKTTIVRVIKLFEIVLMLLSAVGFLMHWFWLLFVVVFGMGVHSTFFSPIKYGVLPAYLKPNELMLGNGLIEAATFMAIIFGTIAGTQVVLLPQVGNFATAVCLIGIAVIGFITCLPMPKAPPSDTTPRPIKLWTDTRYVLSTLNAQPLMKLYIVSSTWFWFVCAVIMTIFPLLVSDVMLMNHNVYTLLLVLFSLGVGIGSMMCAISLRGLITARYTPIAAWGMAAGACFISAFSQLIHNHNEALARPELGTLAQFLFETPHTWWLMLCMFFVSFCAGFYAVPFFALIQNEAADDQKALMFGANNIVNAGGMVAAVAYVGISNALGMSLPLLLLTLAFMCAVGAILLRRLFCT